jgi:DNA polymerase III subunit gamma/tau
MAYTVLARRYRSQTFDDVVGQDAIAQTLKNAIKTGRVAHAYLFSGTRGVGKTTMARILAKSLNCLKAGAPTATPCLKCDSCVAVNTGEDIDVIEIDGASNRGIDNIRDLREKAIYRPARARYKIYIIDEVHMLTTESFNALLKILEEPPSHIKFIFATTEPNKVLPTIQSRCQRFDFVNISAIDIAKQLKMILDEEKVRYEDDVTVALARLGNGSMRDALSVLDQLLSTGIEPLTVKAFEEFLGQPNRQKLAALIGKIGDSDAAGVLTAIDELLNIGQSAPQIVVSMIDILRDVLVVKSAGAKSGLLILTSDERETTAALAEKFDVAGLIYSITTLEKLRWTIKNSDTPRALLEATMLRFALSEHFINVADLLNKSGGGASADVKKKSSPAVNIAAQPSSGRGEPMCSPSSGQTHRSASTSKMDNIESIKNNWQAIRGEIAESAGKNISGLLATAVPTALANGTLTLQFPVTNAILMQMCQSNGKPEVIAAAIGKSIGCEVKVAYELGQGNSAAPPAKPPGARASKQQREEIINDPAVRTLLTGLGATITHIDESQ